MAKSALQARAERAAEEFRASPRPAIVIEFAGLPKAGKTSTLNQVYSFLRRCGFRCEVVVERASVCPIRDKKHFNFNIWTACTSIAQLLEKTQNPPKEGDPDILFLDRGIFDSLCWFSLLEQLGRIRAADRHRVSEFLLVNDWTSRLTGVVAMTADPKEAMKREQGVLPVAGLEGSIMNPTVLRKMDKVIKETGKAHSSLFETYSINTSSKKYSDDFKATCEAVVGKILSWVEESTQENILSAPKNAFVDVDADFVSTGQGAIEIVQKFEKVGDFRPRRRVESDVTRIQPLPVVVVRNRSGHILQLVRKERDPKNKLHKKVAVWAGGHVRREDGHNGSSITRGAIRELQEELRLYVEPEALELIGAVYVSVGEITKKHLAIVYEWRALTDDVEVTLAKSEFYEKGGASLTGVFRSPEQISAQEEGLEAWSVAILTNLLQNPASAKPVLA
jgi:predicted NUDIX family phosphoesterase